MSLVSDLIMIHKTKLVVVQNQESSWNDAIDKWCLRSTVLIFAPFWLLTKANLTKKMNGSGKKRATTSEKEMRNGWKGAILTGTRSLTVLVLQFDLQSQTEKFFFIPFNIDYLSFFVLLTKKRKNFSGRVSIWFLQLLQLCVCSLQ